MVLVIKILDSTTLEKIYAEVRGVKMAYLIFVDDVNAPLVKSFVDAISPEKDESIYLLNVTKLDNETYEKLMRFSFVERRMNPNFVGYKPIPHVASFAPGFGFIDVLYEPNNKLMEEFIVESRKHKN